MKRPASKTFGTLLAFALIAALAVSAPARAAAAVVMFETSKGQRPSDFTLWIADMQAAGYDVAHSDGDISSIFDCDILVVPGETGGEVIPVYTAEEARGIADFVGRGGKLVLLNGNSDPGAGIAEVATAIGVGLDPVTLPWLVFDSDNFDPAHPIFDGVTQCGFFGSSSALGGGTPILWTDATQVQAVTTTCGAGSVIVAASCDFCASYAPESGYAAYDNATLAMNMVGYLTDREESDDGTAPMAPAPADAQEITPTIAMDLFDPVTNEAKDAIRIASLNPYDRVLGTDILGWHVESTLPFRKTVQWKGMTTDYWLDSPLPDGSRELTRVRDAIGPDRPVFWLSDDLIFSDSDIIDVYPSGYISPVLGDTGGYDDIEYLQWGIEVRWCDSAGTYNGVIMLDARQE